MSTRKSAAELAADIRGQLQAHDVSLDELLAELVGPAADIEPGGSSRWAQRALAWFGALLMFAGVGIYAATQWDALAPAARISLTLGGGIVGWVLAVIAHHEERLTNVVVPALVAGTVLEASGILVTLAEFDADSNAHAAVALLSVIIGAQALLLQPVLRRPALPFIATAAGVLLTVTLFDWMDMSPGLNALISGTSVLLIASQRALLPGAAFWLLTGSAAAYFGAWDLLENQGPDWLLLLLPPIGIWAATRLASRLLLTTSAVALLCYLAYFTTEYFSDTIGWPLSLVLLGCALLGISAWTGRTLRRMGTTPELPGTAD